MPVSSTWDAGTGTGSITFSEPVAWAGAPAPGRFRRGLGFNSRQGTNVTGIGTVTLGITVGAPAPPGAPVGWAYNDVAGDLVTASSGVPVAGFSGFS